MLVIVSRLTWPSFAPKNIDGLDAKRISPKSLLDIAESEARIIGSHCLPIAEFLFIYSSLAFLSLDGLSVVKVSNISPKEFRTSCPVRATAFATSLKGSIRRPRRPRYSVPPYSNTISEER